MNTRITKLSLFSTLLAALILLPAQRIMAASFTNLYSLMSTAENSQLIATNHDGYGPSAGMVLSGGVLYGTALGGGTNSNGTLYSLNPATKIYTVLHTFAASKQNFQQVKTNADGINPFATMVLANGVLYGTTQYGGLNGEGALFAMNINGTGFTNLHSFGAAAYNASFVTTNSDGIGPNSALLLLGNTLYGTAYQGGTSGSGTAFSINTNGTAFTLIHNFDYTTGGYPEDGLTASSANILYGTASGGTNSTGMVFAMNTNGTGYVDLFSFGPDSFNSSNDEYTNQTGVGPNGGLALSGKTLFGTTQVGGTNGYGTIFAISTNGSSFTNYHTFTFAEYDNADGGSPNCGLALSPSGSVLYGTAVNGGAFADGTIFSINTNGTGFATLYSMNQDNDDGFQPNGDLVLSNNVLYGVNYAGGANSSGAIFALTLAAAAPATLPELSIRRTGTNMVLAWSTNLIGYTLEFASNAASATWYTNLPAPVVVGTNYAVTNGTFYIRRFYQLIP